jgi:tRNA 2-thiocytidine biosynthesis protein TtcA
MSESPITRIGPEKGLETLRKSISKTMLTTVTGDHLIEEGDHLMVAISGGKDSYTLLDLIHRAQRKAPISYAITAVHLDQSQPGYDGTPLEDWLDESGVPYKILEEDTYTAVAAEMETGGTSCRLCSRLRRGILYTAAEKLGCNKIALGHHRDDALETLLMNLFYSGRLQAMPAKYTTNDGRFEVIRPLIECAESDIADYAARMEFPILPCNLCGSQTDLKRQRVGELISMLEKETPDIRSVMLAALKNVRPSHLLDQEVRDAWLEAADRFEERK